VESGENTPISGSVSLFGTPVPVGNPCKIPVSCFLWKIRSYFILFAKIRQNFPSPNGRQRSLNRAGFCHVFYPIEAPGRLPEREYDCRFFRGLKIDIRVIE